MTRVKSSASRTAWLASAGRAALLAAAVLGVTSCSGGAIGQDTPVSDGQSFVSGSYSSTFYAAGSRPAAPEVGGETLTGQHFSLAGYRGRVVVLNFWGSWCAPCRSEAPALAALSQHFGSDQVSFVGDDVHDSVIAAQAFERTFGISYPSVNDQGEQVALAFHSTVPPDAIPSTLLIDRSGRIAARVVGEVSYSGLRALIAQVLAGKS
ncbi:MAG TPA: TlpA disulfide reductase family protein [Streptosporangiaceae bacterium]|nr:TlpA disulfide reductase family protein [Streptosporangiaceae bacterium]